MGNVGGDITSPGSLRQPIKLFSLLRLQQALALTCKETIIMLLLTQTVLRVGVLDGCAPRWARLALISLHI